MKPFVLKGSELVNTVVLENQTDYIELAQQVKDRNSQLIKSCTMEGKSHDELQMVEPAFRTSQEIRKYIG